MNMFENATKNNFAFASAVGQLNVIDLWSLPLISTKGANLNDVAKAIAADIKSSGEESFVSLSTNTASVLQQDKMDVVKHIIASKIADNTARSEATARSKRKSQLTDILARKQDQEMESLSIEEIQEAIKNV